MYILSYFYFILINIISQFSLGWEPFFTRLLLLLFIHNALILFFSIYFPLFLIFLFINLLFRFFKLFTMDVNSIILRIFFVLNIYFRAVYKLSQCNLILSQFLFTFVLINILLFRRFDLLVI